MMQINERQKLGELLREYPELEKVFARQGLKCAGCKGLEAETLRHVAENHGLPLNRLLSEIKAALKPGS